MVLLIVGAVDDFGVASPLGAQVRKLELDKAASYSACQVLTAHYARYASSKRSERAQPSDGLCVLTQGR